MTENTEENSVNDNRFLSKIVTENTGGIVKEFNQSPNISKSVR